MLIRLLTLFMCLYVIPIMVPPAGADEAHMRSFHADAQSDNWMRSLQRPGGEGSCCSLNDCLPTDAEWRDGEWWAIVRGEWRLIPPKVILQTPISMDGEAWVCAGPQQIYCFVPPLSSY